MYMIYMYVDMHLCVYINYEKNLPSRLSPQCFYGNSCPVDTQRRFNVYTTSIRR